MAKKKSVRNPQASSVRTPAPFPWMEPGYPIQPVYLTDTGETVTLIVLKDEANGYQATVAENPSIRARGKTSQAARHAVLIEYRSRKGPLAEDDADAEISRRRLREPSITLSEYLQRSRRRL